MALNNEPKICALNSVFDLITRKDNPIPITKFSDLYDLAPEKFNDQIKALRFPGVINDHTSIDYFINELKKELGLPYDEAANIDNVTSASDFSQSKEQLGDQENNTKLGGVVEQGGDL